MTREISKQHLQQWNEKQAIAEKMVPLVGSLYRGHSVVIRVFGKKIIHASTTSIIKAHRQGKLIVGKELDMQTSFEMLQSIKDIKLPPCRIDLGKISHEYLSQSDYTDVQSFLHFRLEQLLEKNTVNANHESHDVVLYGFGRIGRILARLLINRTGTGAKLRLRGVVVRAKGDVYKDLHKRAELLRRDSIHGEFDGALQVDEEKKAIIANGNYIQFIYANNPEDIDYTSHGIQNVLIVDNTGVWKDEAGLGRHLKAKGVSKVLLTAPAKDDIKNIVYGVNDHDIAVDDNILCAASCTTNAIVPPLKILHDTFGIHSGHIETIHSYTNDQNLIDNYHKAERRGRSAPLNMVITSTGAAKAVAKVLPQLAGKLTGNAIRVPTPNVSLAVMNLNLNRATSKEELNELFKNLSYHSDLQEQIGFTYSTEVVSSDMVGISQASVIDGGATIAEETRIVLYAWYDNEAGYSHQVVRMMQKVVGLSLGSIENK